jgi:hypothetical protein
VTSVDRRKNQNGASVRRPKRATARPQLEGAAPLQTSQQKQKQELPNEGGCLAVVAVHELSWPYQQQNRNPPSRPSNEAGQGSRP